MFLLVAAGLVSFVTLSIIGLLVYARWHYGKLEKMGIPVVKPHFFLGSTHDLYDIISAPEKDIEWMHKYGGFYGVYEGRDPQIFVCDPELIRLITVKESQYFDAKRRLEFNDPLLNEMPDFLPGEKWRVVRNTSTPAFSSSKIKMMNMPIIDATKDFLDDIKSQIRKCNNNEPARLEKFPVDDAICTMLTDLVFRSCFSIKIADRFNPDNPYAKLVRDLMFPPILRFPKIAAWSFAFPFLLKYIPCTMMNPGAVKDFITLFKGIMAERRNSGQKHNDVVDLCIEWENKLNTPEMKKLNITDYTLLCEAMIFFWVGQDQMSTILATMLYHLAKNPEMEKRLHQEITEIFEKHNGHIQHEQLPEFTYLLACIQEAARLHPFFYRAERVCTKDWKNEQFGLEIPKGMTIQIPIWAANRNPEYFEDPESFIPNRFLPENKDKLHPYALSTFGHGPRNCPGKRFSMECMQLVSAYLLKDLKFEIRSDSELKFKPVGPWMFAPHEQVYMDVIERN